MVDRLDEVDKRILYHLVRDAVQRFDAAPNVLAESVYVKFVCDLLRILDEITRLEASTPEGPRDG